MQDHEPSTSIWPEDLADGQLPGEPASSWPRHFLSSSTEGLVLREPFAYRARAILLCAMALVASFGLGWAGGLNWPEFVHRSGPRAAAQKQTPSSRTSETRSRIDGVRKATSTSALLTPSGASTAGSAGEGSSVRSPSLSAGGAHRSTDWTGSISPAAQANTSPTAVAVTVREPLVSVPETKPTTIPGWTIIEVRDGAAVLEGPDGVHVATRGETIPGLGHVDSIVRWGNRLIVATTHGLISTP